MNINVLNYKLCSLHFLSALYFNIEEDTFLLYGLLCLFLEYLCLKIDKTIYIT